MAKFYFSHFLLICRLNEKNHSLADFVVYIYQFDFFPSRYFSEKHFDKSNIPKRVESG